LRAGRGAGNTLLPLFPNHKFINIKYSVLLHAIRYDLWGVIQLILFRKCKFEFNEIVALKRKPERLKIISFAIFLAMTARADRTTAFTCRSSCSAISLPTARGQ